MKKRKKRHKKRKLLGIFFNVMHASSNIIMKTQRKKWFFYPLARFICPLCVCDWVISVGNRHQHSLNEIVKVFHLNVYHFIANEENTNASIQLVPFSALFIFIRYFYFPLKGQTTIHNISANVISANREKEKNVNRKKGTFILCTMCFSFVACQKLYK